MGALRKLFNDIPMSWAKVIIFALIAGIATGLIMQAPLPENFVVRNIGVTMEAWIFFAMVISANCKKPLEAAIKVFVFFLISQPLVYLTMWPVYHRFPWDYYSYWLIWTFISAPCGAAACYAARNRGMLGAVIVALPCGLLAYHCVEFLRMALNGYYSQWLAVLFCLFQVVVYVAVLIDRPRERVVASGLVGIVFVASFAHAFLTGMHSSASFQLEEPGNYSVVVEDASLVDASVENGGTLNIDAKRAGSTVVTLTGDDGSQLVFDVTVDAKTSRIDVVSR